MGGNRHGAWVWQRHVAEPDREALVRPRGRGPCRLVVSVQGTPHCQAAAVEDVRVDHGGLDVLDRISVFVRSHFGLKDPAVD